MQCNTGGTRGVHCGVISSATAQFTHTIYNENTLHVAVPVGSPVSLPVTTTCTPVVGAGPEMHGVTQRLKLEVAVVTVHLRGSTMYATYLQSVYPMITISIFMQYYICIHVIMPTLF